MGLGLGARLFSCTFRPALFEEANQLQRKYVTVLTTLRNSRWETQWSHVELSDSLMAGSVGTFM